MIIGERFNPYKKFHGSFIPNWLMKRTELSSSSKLVYGRLMQYAGQDGRCFPKQKDLSMEVALQTRQIRNCLSELVKKGLIEMATRRDEMRPNDYFFLTHVWMEGEFVLEDGEAINYLTSGTRLPIQENQLKESKDKNILSKMEDFEQFWNAYPRHTAKTNAMKSWLKIKPDDSLLKTILNAIEAQKQSKLHLKRDQQYIPHPATWLNQERWLDEIQVEFHDLEYTPLAERFGYIA